MSLRMDRLTTLWVTKPLLRQLGPSLRIPILMYHGVGEQDETSVHAYYRTVTTPHMFTRQMVYLRTNGYSAIGLEEVERRLERPTCVNRCVVITFDDGYSDFYLHAYPVLEKYGFTATVFLPTSFIGETRLEFNGKSCLTWSEIRELVKCGVSFGSHTVTHPRLRDVDSRALNEEVVASKRTIEQKLGMIIRSFAYPFAFPQHDIKFKQLLRERLQSAGYTNGVCTSIGRVNGNADPFFLRRLPVNSCDDEKLFEAKLIGAYDWVSKPQSWRKVAKKWWD
jgi:peptidoglycan/xylan/chitin deacetylase (PgdA/CDA1 family)